MDNIKAMRLFLHTNQMGSMSGAGRMFGLSPASVSRHITALEDDLGVRLLNRTSRKLSLTEAGQVYLQRAERLLQDLEEMRGEVTQLNDRPYGTLRVQSRISLGTQHIAPLMPEFLTRYPDLKVELRFIDSDLDLIENTIDVAVRTGNLSDSSLIVRRIGDNPRVICASPDYWAHNPTPTSPSDLSGHNCLTYISDGLPSTWRFRGPDSAPIEMRPTGNLHTNNAETLRFAALAGVGVALLPSWSIQNELANGRLQGALDEYDATATDFDTGIYAVYHSKRHLSVKTRLFVDHLVTGFQKLDWSPTIPVQNDR
jgi:DNA-binding transcriptional LysR family regulator